MVKFCYGYPDLPCAETLIDSFNIPEDCLRVLKRTGIEYIGDVLDVYARIHLGAPYGPRMSAECYATIVQTLIDIVCWPWPDESERWLETED